MTGTESLEPAWLRGLLDARAYPHPCEGIRLIETHISWVFLTGPCAYKLKKPVDFGFVDFSTAALREHFCREELRCNRAFAPELYLDVVPVLDDGGAPRIGDASAATGEARVLEWAVRMTQFDPEAQLDRLVETAATDVAEFSRFGRDLAAQHAALPKQAPDGERTPADFALAPALDNFRALATTAPGRAAAPALERIQRWVRTEWDAVEPLCAARLRDGFVRECHGDLHLANLVRTDRGVRAFDCLEFNADLRWIDTLSDVAFLVMDTAVRGRTDLAYAFLDGYLDATGDYEGARLLRFYVSYRTLVRAKVAALRLEGLADDDPERAACEARFARHLAQAEHLERRGPGTLVLMCGLSGSGKSWLAERLAPQLGALRLRTDVARRGAGGADRYAASERERVYDRLAALTAALLRAGETVIVDGTFITAESRARFLDRIGGAAARNTLVECRAPEAVLRIRIARRAAAGGDPSEADGQVLEGQLEVYEPPDDSAHPQLRVVQVDTTAATDPEALARTLTAT